MTRTKRKNFMIIEDFSTLMETAERKWKEGDRSWTETTHEHYAYFLDVLPPVYSGRCWGVGEPWRHDEHDQPIRLWFRHRHGAFECRYATAKEIRAEQGY